MEVDDAELRQQKRERPLADIHSLLRKFREKKKQQKRNGQNYVLEVQDGIHGAKVRR